MSNKVKFDGEVGSIPLGRITAKKNYASSMQSHKMGATYAFEAILRKLAEEKYPDLANEVNGYVAVKQLPVYGFTEQLVEGTTDTYIREFVGNFTVGADKGDNDYFGFTDERVKGTAFRLEGTDHLKGVGFNYPWEANGEKNIRYNAEKGALCIVTGDDPSKWTAILEQSYCAGLKDASAIEAWLEQEFRPIYECAYRANPLLVGTTATLAEMSSAPESFGNQRRADGRPYSHCEVWRDGEYDLLYFNQRRNQYEKNGVNLYAELSDADKLLVDAATSIEEKNAIFIRNRISRFAGEAHNYICLNDAIYQFTFLLIMVASDNFEKNMYPYMMGTLSSGSRLRFLQDDLDSIFSTDNQAQDTKKYSAEFEDFTDESQSAYVFKGEDSALWQAIYMAFPDRIQRMGRDILQAMYDLSPTGTQTLERLMGFFDEFFFNRAQHYFTKSAYNNDAEIAYEEAWNNKDYVAEVDIHPLAQSLGDHDLAEREFIEKRMVYLMSKFGFGGYGGYSDKELGVISFRTQTAQGFTLTPAIDSFPTILGGASQKASAPQRVKAGEAVTLPAVGGGNTNTYIVGADWLQDIGDLKDLKVDPSMVLALNISSKRLQRIKIGDEDASAVTSTLEELKVLSCPSLTSVDARNLSTLIKEVSLEQCPRLREALFGGTNVTAVKIAGGSKIEHLQLPDSITVLDLRNTKFLDNLEVGDLTHIGFLRLENNTHINGFEKLKEAFGVDGNALQNIRLVGFEYDGDATDVDMLATLANGKFFGIDGEGNQTTSTPVVEGTLNVAGSIYEDAGSVVEAKYPNLTLNVLGGYYLRFADRVVAQICADNWGDKIGITPEQAAAVTDIGTVFNGNTEITSFDEFEYFSGVTVVGGNNSTIAPFYNCINLERIKLPSSLNTLGAYSFASTGLLEVPNLENVTSIQSYAFNKTTKMRGEVVTVATDLGAGTFTSSGIDALFAPKVQSISFGANSAAIGCFANCANLTKVVLGNELTTLKPCAFYGCANLSDFTIPSSVTEIAANVFQGCTSLEIEDLQLPNLETLGKDAFYGVKIKKISDLGKLTSVPLGSSTTQNFGDKSVLEEINIPSTVTALPKYCFNEYSNLKKVYGLEGVTTVDGYVFYKAKNIEYLHFPNIVNFGATYSYYGVFSSSENLNLTLRLGSSCSTIAGLMFSYSKNCLVTLICDAETPPELGGSIFHSASNSRFDAIYVPDVSVERYKTTTNWSDYAEKILPLSEYVEQ